MTPFSVVFSPVPRAAVIGGTTVFRLMNWQLWRLENLNVLIIIIIIKHEKNLFLCISDFRAICFLPSFCEADTRIRITTYPYSFY